jgi:zinc-finger of transposase IS204/IS1001/IS1096/IS1165
MLVVPVLSEALAVIDHQVQGWRLAGPRLVFQISSTAPRPCCPRCRNPNVRQHGHYWRHPSDLPSFGTPVTLDVEVRRWRCMAPGCGGHTFSESMGSFAKPRSRYSKRSRAALEHLGCTSGGQAGARLSCKLGLRAGADTILRAVHALPLPAVGEPMVVGIDDWALVSTAFQDSPLAAIQISPPG